MPFAFDDSGQPADFSNAFAPQVDSMVSDDEPLRAAARRLFVLLAKHRKRIVVAESCTGGAIAAALVGLPGISNWLCGSAVVYRDDTKHRWLGVARSALDDPGVTAVSAQVAGAMAEGVLLQTPEADLAIATTGHLGPGAPEGQDGLMFLGLTFRTSAGHETAIERHALPIMPSPGDSDEEARVWRQRHAATIALESACRACELHFGNGMRF